MEFKGTGGTAKRPAPGGRNSVGIARMERGAAEAGAEAREVDMAEEAREAEAKTGEAEEAAASGVAARKLPSSTAPLVLLLGEGPLLTVLPSEPVFSRTLLYMMRCIGVALRDPPCTLVDVSV